MRGAICDGVISGVRLAQEGEVPIEPGQDASFGVEGLVFGAVPTVREGCESSGQDGGQMFGEIRVGGGGHRVGNDGEAQVEFSAQGAREAGEFCFASHIWSAEFGTRRAGVLCFFSGLGFTVVDSVHFCANNGNH
jgi:hypothetical protein